MCVEKIDALWEETTKNNAAHCIIKADNVEAEEPKKNIS